jgi:hypothetical protein
MKDESVAGLDATRMSKSESAEMAGALKLMYTMQLSYDNPRLLGVRAQLDLISVHGTLDCRFGKKRPPNATRVRLHRASK